MDDAMKVKDIRNLLDRFDDEDYVILSSDPEGNKYSPLSGYYGAAYEPLSTWNGEIKIRELTPTYEKMGYTHEDVGSEDAVPCLVLYPIN